MPIGRSAGVRINPSKLSAMYLRPNIRSAHPVKVLAAMPAGHHWSGGKLIAYGQGEGETFGRLTLLRRPNEIGRPEQMRRLKEKIL